MDERHRQRALRRYRFLAPAYDIFPGAFRANKLLREEAIRLLDLAPGQTVLDAGCGTGLSFDLLQQGIGPQGHIIGLELSPDMLAKAREKLSARGWQNVTLTQAAAEEVDIPGQADAALFFFTHDIMQSDPALKNVLSHVKDGGRVVTAGGKRPSGFWGVPLSVALLPFYAPFVTTTEGASRPWARLDKLLPQLTVRQRFFGAVYIADGRK